MKAAPPPYVGQRVKVGAIGLAVVIVLIALVSAMLNSVTRERPIATGGARPDLVANIAQGNSAEGATGTLSDMGVSPAAENQAGTR